MDKTVAQNIVRYSDNGTTILSCPNCDFEIYGNVWRYDECPKCGQKTNKY